MSEVTGLTVRDLLPTHFDHVDKVVQAELLHSRAGELKRVPDFIWPTIGDKATEAIRGVLDMDVFTLLAAAWAKALELRKFGDESQYPRGVTSTVFLGRHELSAHVHPIVDLKLGGAEMHRFVFDLALAAEVRAAELTIVDGYIVTIGAGDVTVSAQAKYGESPLHPRLEPRPRKLSEPFDLAKPGIAIARPADRQPHGAATPVAEAGHDPIF